MNKLIRNWKLLSNSFWLFCDVWPLVRYICMCAAIDVGNCYISVRLCRCFAFFNSIFIKHKLYGLNFWALLSTFNSKLKHIIYTFTSSFFPLQPLIWAIQQLNIYIYIWPVNGQRIRGAWTNILPREPENSTVFSYLTLLNHDFISS